MPHCIACGAALVEKVSLTSAHWHIKRCLNCGLGRTVSVSPRGQESALYGETYFTGGDESGYDFSTELMRQYDKIRFTAELDEIERLTRRGKILDVGCATGGFLSHARQRGWQVYGYDVSDYAIKQVAREIEDVVVASGVLGADTFPGEEFDVITLHHVLEHVTEPPHYIKGQLLPLLKSGGLLLMEVPNLDSLEARATGEEWEDLRPEQHRWHFTPASLRMLCEGQGLTTELFHTLHNPLWRTRMLTDHLWMAAALLFHLPYGGQVGKRAKEPANSGVAVLPTPPNDRGRRLLSRLSRHIGWPMMALLDRAMRGKRLVLAGRKRTEKT